MGTTRKGGLYIQNISAIRWSMILSDCLLKYLRSDGYGHEWLRSSSRNAQGDLAAASAPSAAPQPKKRQRTSPLFTCTWSRKWQLPLAHRGLHHSSRHRFLECPWQRERSRSMLFLEVVGLFHEHILEQSINFMEFSSPLRCLM